MRQRGLIVRLQAALFRKTESPSGVDRPILALTVNDCGWRRSWAVREVWVGDRCVGSCFLKPHFRRSHPRRADAFAHVLIAQCQRKACTAGRSRRLSTSKKIVDFRSEW